MRILLKIARTELSILFYSPVAWLILISFLFNVTYEFMDIFSQVLRMPFVGYNINSSITAMMLTDDEHGLYQVIQNTIFMYIPLLTMNIMSREYATGTIKLLYSSPLRSSQIILGKYVALIVCSLIFALILFIPVIVMSFTVPNIDISLALSGLLGLFLLVLTYCAVGLFMSTITSYQVVAAVTTLALLGLFRYIGGIGQGVDFVRDITYWLSMNGRASNMVEGLINSKDVIYFILVTALFVSFSILKINQEKVSRSRIYNVGQYLAILMAVIFFGYISGLTKLQLYYDATQNKSNTLTDKSIDMLNSIDGELKITTYANIFDDDFRIAEPKNVMSDMALFDKYRRFKSDITMNYVYYYDHPQDPRFFKNFEGKGYEEIAAEVAGTRGISIDDITSYGEVMKQYDVDYEEGRFFRVFESENGKKSVVRVFQDREKHPSEREILNSLSQLVTDDVTVGFLTGHGERDPNAEGDKHYYNLVGKRKSRSSMINQGYKYSMVDISNGKDIDDNINLLVIADAVGIFSKKELDIIQQYIDKGGNMLILTDANRQKSQNELLSKLGMKISDGVLVQNISTSSAANRVKTEVTPESREIFSSNTGMNMVGGVALEIIDNNKGFSITPLQKTSNKGVWLEVETRDLSVQPTYNVEAGEEMKSYNTAYALTREVKSKEQKIVVIGDADAYSNQNLMHNGSSYNFTNYYNALNNIGWLTDNIYPKRIQYPRDNDLVIDITTRDAITLKRVVIYLPTLLVIGLAFFILRRRKR